MRGEIEEEGEEGITKSHKNKSVQKITHYDRRMHYNKPAHNIFES